MTEEKIAKGDFIDYSLEKNNSTTIPVFSPKEIYTPCSEDNYIFSFRGSLSESIPDKDKYNFTLSLSYPIGITFLCWFEESDKSDNNAIISCFSDRNIKDNLIVIEQTIITYKNKNYFNFKSLIEYFEVCYSGQFIQAEERLKIDNTFKEMNDYKYSKISKALSFKLYTISNNIPYNNYSLKIKMDITFNNGSYAEKKASCSLVDVLNKTEDFLFYQNEYKCFLNLGEFLFNSEEINFNNKSAVTISLNNDEINGLKNLDLEQRSPLKTISLNDNDNNEDISDYNLTYLNLSLNNKNDLGDDCLNKGKIKLIGSFSNDIEEEIIFDLPLSFPSTKLKCKVSGAKKYQNVDIICKNQKEIKLFEELVIEKGFITKNKKELFYINGTKINFNKTQYCKDYNTYHFKKAKSRTKSNFYILKTITTKEQMNQGKFFISIGLKTPFDEIVPQISIKLLNKNTKNKLRNLNSEIISLESINAKCEPILQKNNYANLSCSIGNNLMSGNGDLSEIEFDTDEIDTISGFNGQTHIEQINTSQLLTQSTSNNISDEKSYIDSLNNLPILDIESINGDLCQNEGSFSIIANYKKNSSLQAISYNKISISLSYPDSFAICDISTKQDNNNIIIECLNQEQFSLSQILLETTVIKDNKGNNLFRLNNFTSSNQFSCKVGISKKKNNTFDYKDAAVLGIVILIIILVIIAIISGCCGKYIKYLKDKGYLPCKPPSPNADKSQFNDSNNIGLNEKDNYQEDPLKELNNPENNRTNDKI